MHIKGWPTTPCLKLEQGIEHTLPCHKLTAIKSRSKPLISLSPSHTHTHTHKHINTHDLFPTKYAQR